MPNNLTPEEKLLNLIRRTAQRTAQSSNNGTDRGKTSNENPRLSNKPGTLLSVFFANLSVRMNQTGKTVSALPFLKYFKFRDIYAVPKTLKWLSLSFVFLLILSISSRIFITPKVNKLLGDTEKEPSISAAPKIAIEKTAAKPITEFQYLKQKDIFKAVEGNAGYAPSSAPARGETMNYVLESYSLSGIIMGEKPQAVIENKKQGQTYILYKGDCAGEIAVEDIQKGKVTVIYSGESVDLTL